MFGCLVRVPDFSLDFHSRVGCYRKVFDTDARTPEADKINAAYIQEARNKLSLTLELNMRIPEIKEIFRQGPGPQ